MELPDESYRNILWFGRKDAPVFFRRGYEIRGLYRKLTDESAPSVLLYYRQSSIGKSSLLAAGLLPRLDQEQDVIYERRDVTLGLTRTLAKVLQDEHFRITGVDVDAAQKEDLRALWLAVENATQRPLTLLLDQIEEAYTRPNASGATKISHFIEVVKASVDSTSTRPLGRLVLSLRKVRLAEVTKLLKGEQLAYTELYLERLRRRGRAGAGGGVLVANCRGELHCNRREARNCRGERKGRDRGTGGR